MGDAFRVGLGGPVGAGKTSLTASLCKVFSENLSMAVITNDIYTKEDAEILMRKQVINSERILAVETGGCPHTAIREDASINLQAVDKLSNQFPDLDLILLESGGDNLSATFSPELVDYTIFMIDVCMGEEIPRKGGPAIIRSDLLIINKIDLAEYVDVSVDQMFQDAIAKRNGRPVLLTNLKQEKGVDAVKNEIMKMGNLKA
jgi:urease accessory protein|tara:strand:+ start:307 stop:915 length:609 start_codon:yes stop_codon:yes gene_type:complete